jgi:hypothetical protein
MNNHPDALPEFANVQMDPEAKARRLQRFLGPLVDEDAEQAAFWRERSDAEHARAGAQLSDMAAQLAVQTGQGKHPDEMFPGLSHFARARSQAAG